MILKIQYIYEEDQLKFTEELTQKMYPYTIICQKIKINNWLGKDYWLTR